MFKIKHAFGLLTHPKETWVKISEENNTIFGHFVGYVLFLALLGPAAGYFGTTSTGWQIGSREAVRLSHESALTIAVMYYFMMLGAVVGLGILIQWISKTYNGICQIGRAISLAGYVATPIFLVGLIEIFPILWLNLLFGLCALAYTVYLLYIGVPIMMKINENQGFLMSSALLGLGMVTLVTMLAITALAWGFGFEPQFTN